MRNLSKQTVLIIVSLVFAAAILYGAALYWTARSNAYCAQMTIEGNIQTDVLVPFIQQHRLAQYPPDEAMKSDFRAYLEQLVASKRLGKADAESILKGIQSIGQSLPVYTSRGWIMPLIAQGF